LFARDEWFDGTFFGVHAGKARLAIPGLHMRGEVTLEWANDEQFSFSLDGLGYTATRR
jgi:hypothetical protein